MNYQFSVAGRPGATVKKSVDAVIDLIDQIDSTLNGKYLCGAVITVEDNAVRLAFGGATATNSYGHVVAAGGSWSLNSPEMVKQCSICADTAGSVGVLMITPFYEY